MSSTYSHIPLAISDIFRLIVAQVSANLASDDTLNIGQISFMHGTLMDINNQLASKERNPNKKGITFPMVLFLYKADENFIDKYNDEISVEMLICTSTKKEYSNDDRYSINFLPVLYPIYAELKSVIGKSRFFWGYKRKFQHTKTDLPHAGQESANGPAAYNFSTPIDAIMLSNMKLKVAIRPLEMAPPNYCQFTACPYGREIWHKNIFKNVSFTGAGDTVITATVNSYEWLNATGGLPAPFSPEIDWQGDQTFVPMTAAADGKFTSSFNTATGYGPGTYFPVIRHGAARVEFYYKIVTTVVTKMTDLITQSVSLNLDCRNDPDYPFTVVSSHRMAIQTTGVIPVGQEEHPIIVGYQLEVFGTQKVNETFTETFDREDTTTGTTGYLSATESINNKYLYGGQTPLTNTSIFKTRCKTTF
jgi:hypothetical protein